MPSEKFKDYLLLALITKQDIINLNGGAIASGHPLGCSGAPITTTLSNVMKIHKSVWVKVSRLLSNVFNS